MTAPVKPCGVTLDRAIVEWLDDRFSAPEKAGTRRQYGLTLRRVAAWLGAGDQDVTTVSAMDYARALRALWAERADATWNANRANVCSFLTWLREWAEYVDVKLPKRCAARTIADDETKAVDREDLDVLWEPDTAGLRERSLWRVKYESSSRAEALLALDIEDLDLARRRARVTVKGGKTVWIHFGEMGAALLAEYIGDRTSGPVWLTERRPWNWRSRPVADRGPGATFRLSYNRAESIFKETTSRLGFSGNGRAFDFLTLHQLRHSRLTHLAEDGVDTPALQAISTHRDPRTLHRKYTKVSSRAVADVMAAADRREAMRRREDARRRPSATRGRPRAARVRTRPLRR
ncbi:site-specific integrase [Streptomyces sp. NPDC046374]|uniref:tyrosine-type recombinase/integrase n=1 Tax=Streptomyces sp. NPDC046374 TaxID=3154917 RepID=UPI0033E86968